MRQKEREKNGTPFVRYLDSCILAAYANKSRKRFTTIPSDMTEFVMNQVFRWLFSKSQLWRKNDNCGMLIGGRCGQFFMHRNIKPLRDFIWKFEDTNTAK